MSLPAFSSCTTQPPKKILPHTSQTRLLPNPSRKSVENTHLSFPRKDQLIDQTVLWTSSIARRCRNGHLSEAAAEFARMRIADIEPNYITFITLLSACADFPSENILCFGASIHCYIYKLGINKYNVMLGTAIVDMYSKCSRVDLARQAFDEMTVKNSVSWNSMIDGYMRNGDVEDAIKLFDEMPHRDKVSWTALIGGFVKRGHFEEALERFREMQISGVEPDYVTIIAILTACANLGALGLGIWIHRFALQRNLSKEVRVSNSLIDMYSRCGCVNFAYQEFNKMGKRSRVSWNSMIVGFAINGRAEEALEHFCLMQKEGFEPDGVSFTGALTACSHAGLVEEGLEFYKTMTRIHGISPRIEHFGCMVDLLSRAGRLEDALSVIETMPMKPNEVVLGSLLAACRTHGDVGLAERLMNFLDELEPDTDSNYVLLSNIYAVVGRWEGVGKVRKTMKALGIKKKPGVSAIEIDCSIHEFVAGDKSHVQTESIYSMLEQLSAELMVYGYVSETIVEGFPECD
ncbi:Pentatricopeptide repeat [Macleaya cordata]|uniref:Pentatricopeptide repeat n=1 Tax=Macleaya cordata TaxID=56857 RepID=A0A200QJM0_MACCD|nr:Pentatricopeptide repeat [Macleaya cordata]